jgi:hypothetical protein
MNVRIAHVVAARPDHVKIAALGVPCFALRANTERPVRDGAAGERAAAEIAAALELEPLARLSTS